MPKVSIIIPIYNNEVLLDRCLQSVINQTETNWECILVDDGSKDRSGNICDDYAAKESRFKVFHRTNHGPSSSRNFGLDKANGEFICFIDSDDYVKPDFLRHLLEPMLDDSVKMTVTGMIKFGNDRGQYPKEANNRLINSKQAFDNLLGGTNSSIKGWLWNKCFRANLLRNYRMCEELRYCEDLEMVLRVLYEQPKFKIALVNEYDYYYYVQETGKSLSRNVQNRLHMISEFNRCIDVYPDSKSKRIRLLKGSLIQCRSLATFTSLNADDIKILKKARMICLKYLYETIVYFKLHQIVQIILILINFGLYKTFLHNVEMITQKYTNK